MKQFKFFYGIIDDTITYWSADPILNNSEYGAYWSNEDPEEIRRQQRIQQQREQTNRMRNFGYNNRYRTRSIGPR
jgi:hypothetical protein